MAELGIKLAAAREAAGLSQEKAAQLTGTTAKTISRLEGGTGNPTLSTLLGLAKAYGVAFKVIENEVLLLEQQEGLDKDKKVSDVTVGELENIVARASKRDGAINLKLKRMERDLARFRDVLPVDPDSLPEDLPVGIKAACLFLLTQDERLLDVLSADTHKFLETVLRSLGKKKTSRRQ